MENLNAEQAKRGLECLNNKIDRDCDTCPIFWKARKSTVTQNCRHIILDAALALINSQEQRIKELTERNEILEAKNKLNDRVGAEYIKVCEENERLTKELKIRESDYSFLADKHKAVVAEKKQLAEENERLTNRITCQVVLPDEKLEEIKNECLERVELDIKKIEGDTVRMMQEALEQRIHSKLSYHGWYLKETVIAETAKELLESGDG